MWEIFESHSFVRKLPRVPVEVLRRYEKWKDIVSISGPSGLRAIKGFHDEVLSGKWKGHRSSRLGIKYRVIYKIQDKMLYVQVIDITAHEYRRS